MKDVIMRILFLAMKIIPIILVLTFFVGVFFNLWKVQGIHPILAGCISVTTCVLIGYGFGKLIKLW
jgi:hypothetical protein